MGLDAHADLLASTYTIAIGPGSIAKGRYATAIGEGAKAYGDGTSSLGTTPWIYHDTFKWLLDTRPEHVTPRRLELLDELRELKAAHPGDFQIGFWDQGYDPVFLV